MKVYEHRQSEEPAMNKFVAPCGINHLLLNVRDIEESHRFRLDIPKADSRLRPQRVDCGRYARVESNRALSVRSNTIQDSKCSP